MTTAAPPQDPDRVVAISGRVPASLKHAAKVFAAQHDCSIQGVLAKALQEFLHRQSTPGSAHGVADAATATDESEG